MTKFSIGVGEYEAQEICTTVFGLHPNMSLIVFKLALPHRTRLGFPDLFEEFVVDVDDCRTIEIWSLSYSGNKHAFL